MATKHTTHKSHRGAFTKGTARKIRNRNRATYTAPSLEDTARVLGVKIVTA